MGAGVRDHAAQELDRFFDAFLGAHRRILVLDRQHAVVADARERRDELAPPRLVVAHPERDVAPRARPEIAAGRGVDDAVDAGIDGIDARVLRMHVVDGVAERDRRRQRIGTHPHEVAGVEVGADRFPHGVAQPLERRDVVDVLIAVKLETQARNALLAGIGDEIAPVGDQHLVPLPAQHVADLGRPLGGDPVRMGVARRAGTSGHHHDTIDAHEAGEPYRLARHFVVPAAGLARVHRVAGAVERADPDAVRVEPGAELAPRRSRFRASGRARCAAPSTSCRSRIPAASISRRAATPSIASKSASGRLSVIIPICMTRFLRWGGRAGGPGEQAKPYHIRTALRQRRARRPGSRARAARSAGIGYIARSDARQLPPLSARLVRLRAGRRLRSAMAGRGARDARRRWHLARARQPGREGALVLIAAAIGVVFESALIALGWVRYPYGTLFAGTRRSGSSPSGWCSPRRST